MRTFIYGRPAVEKGDRGYRVFKSQDLEPEAAKQIKDLFSDEDPDVRQLDQGHFLPFYAYFPWRDRNWIFGKGKIETHGRLGAMYYSYLFHGVLLDELERQSLRFNPFILANCFDLEGERRTQLPQIPDKVNQKGYYLNLMNHIKTQAPAARSKEAGRAGLGAGFMASVLLGQPNADRLLFPHSGQWGSAFWALVYFLLPLSTRREVSLATWDPFLQTHALLRGVADPATLDPSLRPYLIDAERPGKTVFGDLLNRLESGLADETWVQNQMKIYEAAAEDFEALKKNFGQMSSDALEARHKQYMEKLFFAMERPSVKSVGDWPEAGVYLLARKIHHFRQVWQRNSRDAPIHFPGLATKLWQGLMADFHRLAADFKGDYEADIRAFFSEIGAALGDPELAGILGDPCLATWLGGQIGSRRFIRALTHPDRDPGTLERAFRLRAKSNPAFAKDLESIVQRISGSFLRATLHASQNAFEIERDRRVLGICLKTNDKAFKAAVGRLIYSFLLDHALPHLDRDLFVACLQAWAETLERDQLKFGQFKRTMMEDEIKGEEPHYQWAKLRLMAACHMGLKRHWSAKTTPTEEPSTDWSESLGRFLAEMKTNWLLRTSMEMENGAGHEPNPRV